MTSPTPSSSESTQTTLRQILQQKWSAIEHYDRQDQNLLVSVFALVGGAIALGKLRLANVDRDILTFACWFAVVLAGGATASVLRSFVEYYRCLSIICRIEQALGVNEVVGERPSFPDERKVWALFVGLLGKLVRTWRVFLLAMYTVIGVTAFALASGRGWILSGSVWAIFALLAYTWLVVLPMRK